MVAATMQASEMKKYKELQQYLSLACFDTYLLNRLSSVSAGGFPLTA